MQLSEIEKLASRLAEVRNELSAVITRLQLKQGELMREAMPDIRRAVGNAANRHAVLITAIDAHRHLFDKPKSQITDGIRFGLRKGSGGITWDDDDQVVKLIEKQYPADQAQLLIKTTKKPIKSALNDLEVSELKKIGCAIEGSSDVAFAKPVDGAVDKIVNALLKSAISDKLEEAA